MDKPIPEAVQKMLAGVEQHLTWAQNGVPRRPSIAELREWRDALTAAQQQGQGGGEVEPDGYTSYGEFRWACDCDERQRREWTPVYLAPPSAPVAPSGGGGLDDIIKALDDLENDADTLVATGSPAMSARIRGARDVLHAAIFLTPPPSAPVGVEGLPQPFGYVEPRHDLSGYEVFDEPGPRRAAIWNLHGMQQALAQKPAAAGPVWFGIDWAKGQQPAACDGTCYRSPSGLCETHEAEAHAAQQPAAVDDAMVERTARAICTAHGWNPDEPVKYAGTNRIARERDGSPAPQWTMHVTDARAALIAAQHQEPTT